MGGKDFVYRVEIEPHRDSIRTFVSTREGYQVPRIVGFIVPKGNRWTIDVQLGQGLGNTYKGELELEAIGLPKGVTMMAARVPKNATTVPVQFIAEVDASGLCIWRGRGREIVIAPGSEVERGFGH